MINTIRIGKLEYLTEDPIESYGDYVTQYFKKLEELEGREMPYEDLISNHIMDLDGPEVASEKDGVWWSLGFKESDQALTFVASETIFGGIYRYLTIANSELNHDLAKLYLN